MDHAHSAPVATSTTELRRLSGLLQTVTALAAVAMSQHALAPTAHAGPAHIDGMLGAITTVLAQSDALPRVRVRVSEVSPDVRQLAIRRMNAIILPPHPYEIWIDVRASAQMGGLLLSMGATHINFGSPYEWFSWVVGGNRGSALMTFGSGTTIADLALAIRSLAPLTGVDAVDVGTAVRLQSCDYGSNQFVSVRIISDGDLLGAATGIYTMNPYNFYEASPGSRVPFDSYAAAAGVGDLGRDIYAYVDGVPCLAAGTTLMTRTWLVAEIDLGSGRAMGPANAQTIGAFSAFGLTPY